MKQRTRILFLCTGNACRSQMAEGWTRKLKGETVEAFSAGVTPKGLDAMAVEAMAEAGVDISKHRSKHVSEFKDAELDYVVTVCDEARESCPVFPGKAKMIHVGFEDPPRMAEGAKTREEAMAHYRRIRDEIKAFVEKLPGGLNATS